MRAHLGTAAVCLGALLSAVAQAQEPPIETLIDQALAAEQSLEYDVAAEHWDEIISRHDLSEAQRLRANFHAGSVARVRGRDVEARMHFVYVLERHPSYILPEQTSPKIRNFFELVRQEVQNRPETRGPSTGTSGPGGKVTGAAPSEAAPEGPPWLLIGGGGIATAGLLVIATAGVLGWSAQQAHEAALASDVQLDRRDLYDERDQLGLIANMLYGAGALITVGGAVTSGIGLLAEGS